jgi:hypothetical protein
LPPAERFPGGEQAVEQAGPLGRLGRWMGGSRPGAIVASLRSASGDQDAAGQCGDGDQVGRLPEINPWNASRE